MNFSEASSAFKSITDFVNDIQPFFLSYHTYQYNLTHSYTVQKNSVHPLSHNLKILIIRHLRRLLPRTEVLLFTRKKELHHWNRVMSVLCSEHPLSLTIVVCADPFSPTPLTSSTTKTQKTHKRTPDNPETADEGNIPVEYSSN
jgi:hypothetical protein